MDIEFKRQQQLLANIRQEAESGGNSEWYDRLREKVEELSRGWDAAAFGFDKMTRLIQDKFATLDYIEAQRNARI